MGARPPRFWQNRRCRRAAAARCITTCLPRFETLLHPWRGYRKNLPMVKKSQKWKKKMSNCPILVKVCNFEAFCFLINCVLLNREYFVSTVRKKCSIDWEKRLNSRLKAENLQKNCSNSKSSVQFLKQNAFLTCSWKFVRYIRTIRIQIEKNNWDLETYRKRQKIEIF